MASDRPCARAAQEQRLRRIVQHSTQQVERARRVRLGQRDRCFEAHLLVGVLQQRRSELRVGRLAGDDAQEAARLHAHVGILGGILGEFPDRLRQRRVLADPRQLRAGEANRAFTRAHHRFDLAGAASALACQLRARDRRNLPGDDLVQVELVAGLQERPLVGTEQELLDRWAAVLGVLDPPRRRVEDRAVPGGELRLPLHLHLGPFRDALRFLLLRCNRLEGTDGEDVHAPGEPPRRQRAFAPHGPQVAQAAVAPDLLGGLDDREGDEVFVQHPVVPCALGVARRVRHHEIRRRLRARLDAHAAPRAAQVRDPDPLPLHVAPDPRRKRPALQLDERVPELRELLLHSLRADRADGHHPEEAGVGLERGPLCHNGKGSTEVRGDPGPPSTAHRRTAGPDATAAPGRDHPARRGNRHPSRCWLSRPAAADYSAMRFLPAGDGDFARGTDFAGRVAFPPACCASRASTLASSRAIFSCATA